MITVISCFYNEAPILPFFLSHYHYVDAIHAFVSRSIDATRELLAANPRVRIEDVEFPAGFDDEIKVGWINQAILSASQTDPAGWVLVVDADEFLWPAGDPTGATAHAYLASVPARDVALPAHLVNVYRVTSDGDLDATLAPAVFQRRHGVDGGTKPSVFRTTPPQRLVPGNHRFIDGTSLSTTHAFQGAHWQNADPSYAITRRIRDRKERLSARNITMRHGWHHLAPTAVDIAQELERHRHDAAQF